MGQFYQVLPDDAEAHGLLRVVDNTGEDYLFDADLFEVLREWIDERLDLPVGAD